MREAISIILVIIGTTFMFIAALGVVKMPDLYLRMSAATKSGTLGVITLLLATAIFFDELGTLTRAVAVILFMLLTAPVAAHMIGRAAYFNGVPLWEETLYDELRGQYDIKTHTLTSPDEGPPPNPSTEPPQKLT